jgi:hypothetical protein
MLTKKLKHIFFDIEIYISTYYTHVLRRCGTISLLFKVVPEIPIYRLENKKI